LINPKIKTEKIIPTGIDIRSGINKKESIRYTANPESMGQETNTIGLLVPGVD
jgi:hypothetical protein